MYVDWRYFFPVSRKGACGLPDLVSSLEMFHWFLRAEGGGPGAEKCVRASLLEEEGTRRWDGAPRRRSNEAAEARDDLRWLLHFPLKKLKN